MDQFQIRQVPRPACIRAWNGAWCADAADAVVVVAAADSIDDAPFCQGSDKLLVDPLREPFHIGRVHQQLGTVLGEHGDSLGVHLGIGERLPLVHGHGPCILGVAMSSDFITAAAVSMQTRVT